MQSSRIVSFVLLAVAACVPEPTQVMVRVQADPALADLEGPLVVEIYGGRDDASTSLIATERVEPARFPYLVAIAPRGDTASRRWRVVARLESSSTVQASARGGFQSERSKLVELRLGAGCVDVSCDVRTTCVEGDCVDDSVDVGTLPDFDPRADAGPRDGGVDGEVVDAGDAGEADAGELDGGDGRDGGDGGDGGMDGGMDGGSCEELPCEPESCFAGVVDCADAPVVCARSTAPPRMSGSCNTNGTCNPDGYCVSSSRRIDRRPAFGTMEGIFAEAIGFDGRRLITGSPQVPLGATDDAGRLVIFEDGTPAELTLPDPQADDALGAAVAIAGNRAVASARGGVAIFTRDDLSGAWSLTTLVGGIGRLERHALAMQGSRIVAGAHLIDGISGDSTRLSTCGSVESVALEGNLVAIGCDDTPAGTVEIVDLASPASPAAVLSDWHEGFGYSVDLAVIDGTTRLAVGAFGWNRIAGESDGAVLVYDRGASPADWTLIATIQPRDHVVEEGNQFGTDVALLADGRLVVSGPTYYWGTGASAPWPGAVLVFERDTFGSFWERRRITSTMLRDSERFGDAIAVDGTTLLVTANDGSAEPGAVYWFDL